MIIPPGKFQPANMGLPRFSNFGSVRRRRNKPMSMTAMSALDVRFSSALLKADGCFRRSELFALPRKPLRAFIFLARIRVSSASRAMWFPVAGAPREATGLCVHLRRHHEDPRFQTRSRPDVLRSSGGYRGNADPRQHRCARVQSAYRRANSRHGP